MPPEFDVVENTRDDLVKEDFQEIADIDEDAAVRRIADKKQSGPASPGLPTRSKSTVSRRVGSSSVRPQPARSSVFSFKVQRVAPNARTPKRGTPHAHGYNVFAAKPCVIPPKGNAIIDLGLKLSPPAG